MTAGDQERTQQIIAVLDDAFAELRPPPTRKPCAAAARWLPDRSRSPGDRTEVWPRALRAYADPWAGWTELDGTGFVVREFSPYQQNFD